MPKNTRNRGIEADCERDLKSCATALPLARVKAVAQQEESIGKMGMEATHLIGRCADAFLVDLVKASVARARDAGHREADKKVRKRAATQQVLPEDVRKAVAEEERFDFLRPVLSPPQDRDQSLLIGGAGGKRKCGATSNQSATRDGRERKGKNRTEAESAFPTARGMAAAVSGLLGSGGLLASNAKEQRSNVLELEGLDEEGRRRALVKGWDTKPPVASWLDDDDEDYDNP